MSLREGRRSISNDGAGDRRHEPFELDWSGATQRPQTLDARTPSVAHLWNEALLDAIRKDFARPTVHARTLLHISAAMYDAWALCSDTASTYLAGKTVQGYTCALSGVSRSGDLQLLREEAISYAAYRMIRPRFGASPGAAAMNGATGRLIDIPSHS